MDTAPDKYLKEYKEQLIKIWFILMSFSFNGNDYYRSNQFSGNARPDINSVRWKKNQFMRDVDTKEVQTAFSKTFFEKVVLNCALLDYPYGNDEFIQSIDWKIFTEAKLKIMKSMGSKQIEEEYDLKNEKKENEDIRIYNLQCTIILTLPLDINYLASKT